MIASKRLHICVRYLAWFMLFVTLVNFQQWIVFLELPNFFPEVFLFFLPMQLLTSPYFLLFVIFFLDHPLKEKRIRFWVFAPFLIFLLIHFYMKADIMGNDLSYAVAMERYFPIIKLEEAITLFYGLFTCLWSLQMIRRFEHQYKNKKYDHVIAQTAWLKRILSLGIALLALWALSLLFDLVSIYRLGNYVYLPAWFGYLSLIIYIGYSGFVQASVLTERQELNRLTRSRVMNPNFNPHEKADDSTKKYFQKLESLMASEKIFLNPYLDLHTLAKEVAISPNYLSKVVNSHAEVHFSDYVNTYRVEYAKNMLNAVEFKDYTMLSIALEAGFNSKSAFYTAFNKLAGHPPGYYRSSS